MTTGIEIMIHLAVHVCTPHRLSTKSNNYVQSLIDGQPQSTTYIPLETYNEHMLKVLSSQHIISVEQLQLLEKIGQGIYTYIEH